jgi:pyruvate formate lyase activating enzyme
MRSGSAGALATGALAAGAFSPATGRYQEKLEDRTVRCGLCHHRCIIKPGGSGICTVRANRSGNLVLPYYGGLSAVAVDPMEKKPLYHFMPGRHVLSVGYLGCNLHCPFCQNYGISQTTLAPTENASPKDIVALALARHCPAVAHTYSEPLVHIEFVMEAMEAARSAGLKNVLVTNGQCRPGPAKDVLALCDAVNVDIKAWDPHFYKKELGGNLKETLAFIRIAVECGVHVEATTLVIPGKNDDDAQIAGIAGFLADLSPAIPLHLSAYRPSWHYTIPSTPVATIQHLCEVAGRSLRNVYAGNIGIGRNDTHCHSCQAVLVRRRGYETDCSGLSGLVCASCGAPSDIACR